MEATQKLKQLIIDNPDLEIVPFVSGECGNSDYGWMQSGFHSAEVDEYVVSPYDDERLLFKSSGFEDFETDYIETDMAEREEIPDEEIKQAFEALEWEKAILVYVEVY